MWCNATSCFSQSFTGYYTNYGPLGNNLYNPVYVCTNATSLVSLSVTSLSASAGNAKIEGKGFGDDRNSITAFLATDTKLAYCSNVELCSSVCQGCSTDDDCPPFSSCFRVRVSSGGTEPRCLPYCAGYNDLSCPCNSYCKGVYVKARSGVYLSKNLCTYNDNFVCPTKNDSSVVRCSAYGAVPSTGTTTAPDPVSVTALLEVVPLQAQTYTANVSMEFSCDSDIDCEDGNLCTVNICDMSTKSCRIAFYSDDQHCQSMPVLVQQRSSPYTYLGLDAANMTMQQMDFVSFMTTNGLALDTAPRGRLHSIYAGINGFGGISLHENQTFEYFGNVIREIAVNPNGIVSLAPIPPCNSFVNDLYVRSAHTLLLVV